MWTRVKIKNERYIWGFYGTYLEWDVKVAYNEQAPDLVSENFGVFPVLGHSSASTEEQKCALECLVSQTV